MDENMVHILVELYSWDHRGELDFLKNPEEACYGIDTRNTKEGGLPYMLQRYSGRSGGLEPRTETADPGARKKGYVPGTLMSLTSSNTISVILHERRKSFNVFN